MLGQSPIILIADDDLGYDDDLRDILGFEGYEDVRIATTCEEMVRTARLHRTAIVIVLDMMLPWNGSDANGGMPPEHPEELRGLRAVHDLKEMGFDLRRIIVITAFHSPAAEDQLREFGVEKTNIFLKPARTRELLARIRGASEIRPE